MIRFVLPLIIVWILALPIIRLEALSLSPTEIVLSQDKTREIEMLPSALGTTVEVYDKSIAEAYMDKGNNRIIVKARKQGQTILTAVNSKGEFAAARILVRDPAGKIPSFIKISVTGNPATEELLKSAVEKGIYLASDLVQGAKVKMKSLEMNSVLYPGEWTMARASVSQYGENCFTVTGDVMVVVENHELREKADDLLFVSNNPEVLQSTGKVFEGEITAGESSRLLYHHGNLIGHDVKYLSMDVDNPSDQAAELYVTQGLGGPSVDSLFVGHVAAKRFLNREMNEEGLILSIPPGKRIRFFTQTIPAGKYISGIVKIWLVSGKQVKVSLISDDERSLPLGKDVANYAMLDRDNVASHARGRFETSQVTIEKAFTTSQEYDSVEMGFEPKVFESTTRQKLVGNYGLYHNYIFNLSNDKPDAKKIEISFVPGGGFARGCFVIDGNLVETRVLDPYKSQSQVIYNVQLKPDETKKLYIRTLPQSGAYYPVRIVIKTT